ncbi:Zinc finger, RING/FYVE/PHD-type [Artemisia annua]|uniref:Zinc finger, RING/FYVE/PHD-type n=1 Tax=Artemisia annua TaxID=35608 RepID=A0A2U1LXN5_ARTAN|nr:Zinc finger, RING/FYVE/PHD-type [Artemisia annua]
MHSEDEDSVSFGVVGGGPVAVVVSRVSLICFSQTEVIATSTSNRFDPFSLPAAKLLRNIPIVTYSAETMAEKFSDCAICLSEFVAGDEVRVLPPCNHCFHVECVDRWIGLHFTCPSCRQLLLKTMIRCNVCDDEVPVAQVTGI